jgi:hypothetical protein
LPTGFYTRGPPPIANVVPDKFAIIWNNRVGISALIDRSRALPAPCFVTAFATPNGPSEATASFCIGVAFRYTTAFLSRWAKVRTVGAAHRDGAAARVNKNLQKRFSARFSTVLAIGRMAKLRVDLGLAWKTGKLLERPTEEPSDR